MYTNMIQTLMKPYCRRSSCTSRQLPVDGTKRLATELEHLRPQNRGGTHLFQEVVAEGGHELGRAGLAHRLVAELLKGLLEGLVEQGVVAEAVRHVLHARPR